MLKRLAWLLAFSTALSAMLAIAFYFSFGGRRELGVFAAVVFCIVLAGSIVSSALAWMMAVGQERFPEKKNPLQVLLTLVRRKPLRGALWQVVDGRLAETRASERRHAPPAHVIISKDHAVVFEDKMGKFTHVEVGPLEIEALPGDELANSIVLITRPRFKRLSVQNVTTKDGIVLERVDFSIYYHLKTDPTQYRAGNSQFPISEETLTQAVYAVTFGEDEQHNPIATWDAAVHEAAKHALRTEIANKTMLQFYMSDNTPSPIREIADKALRRLSDLAGRWGATAESLDILFVGIPQPLRKVLEEKWIAERSQDIKKAEGIAEGKRIEEIEHSKANAWESMAHKMRESFGKEMEWSLLATQYIEILEYLDSLVRIAQHTPNRATMPPPPQFDEMLRGFEDRFNRLRTSEGRSAEKPLQDIVSPNTPYVERRPEATIVGRPIEDESVVKDNEPSRTRSGAAEK